MSSAHWSRKAVLYQNLSAVSIDPVRRAKNLQIRQSHQVMLQPLSEICHVPPEFTSDECSPWPFNPSQRTENLQIRNSHPVVPALISAEWAKKVITHKFAHFHPCWLANTEASHFVLSGWKRRGQRRGATAVCWAIFSYLSFCSRTDMLQEEKDGDQAEGSRRYNFSDFNFRNLRFNPSAAGVHAGGAPSKTARRAQQEVSHSVHFRFPNLFFDTSEASKHARGQQVRGGILRYRCQGDRCFESFIFAGTVLNSCLDGTGESMLHAGQHGREHTSIRERMARAR